MAHTQTKELNKIPMGSGTFYVTEWSGTIPEDSELEKEGNIIGRTKNGATIEYQTNYYTAKSDDGKAQKTKLISDSATISYGMITWNAKTLEKLIATASVAETGGKRTAMIGGVANDNGKLYLLRFVHEDAKDGDVRYTAVGKNTGGWSAVYSPDNETIINANFECSPIDEDGHLIKYEEEVIETTASQIAEQTAALKSEEAANSVSEEEIDNNYYGEQAE